MPISYQDYNKSDEKSSTTAGKSPRPSPETSSREPAETPAGTGDGEESLSKEEKDRLYEERMEEEYAKREGGA